MARIYGPVKGEIRTARLDGNVCDGLRGKYVIMSAAIAAASPVPLRRLPILRFPFLPLGLTLILIQAACATPPIPSQTSLPASVPQPVHSGPSIEISPQPALVDRKLSIRVLGLKPGQAVTLTADAQDNLGRPWQSYATFRADNEVVVDLGSQMPEAGPYNIVDAMGLFWSLHLLDARGTGDINFEDDVTPRAMQITFTAQVDGRTVASTGITRELAGDSVTRTVVSQNGLAGILYLPAGPGPHPAVIILGGAEGGLHSDEAALLASHGLASLDLACFGYDGLPNSLENIPLEYFQMAIQWLQTQNSVRADRLAIVGASRGGELALLLGVTFPQIKAVVGYVAGSYLGPGDNSLEAAWTFGGKPLPYVPDFDTLFAAARGDRAAIQSASAGVIKVEKINGPVLLISAKDDRLWPSFEMSNEIMQRLADYHHPYPDRHLSYEGAGHLILEMVPYLPYTAPRDPVNITRYINYYGGTIAGDAEAEADSWPQVVSFLTENLK